MGTLVAWKEVHMQLAEVLRELLDKDDKTEVYFDNFRENYLEAINKLLKNTAVWIFW